MTSARALTAEIKLGESIQRKSTTINKIISRLADELVNMKEKATDTTYTPEGMDVSIPISDETRADMLSIGTDVEVKLRVIVDDLKAFLES